MCVMLACAVHAADATKEARTVYRTCSKRAKRYRNISKPHDASGSMSHPPSAVALARARTNRWV